MNLANILDLFAEQGCDLIYAKRLSENDNSKNQVYLGGSFDVLNILPFSEVKADDRGDYVKTRFKASLNFFWLTDQGGLSWAPRAQLILYPKYPEVRFSGFLQGAMEAPSDLMANRIAGRVLLFSTSKDGKVLGYVISPESEAVSQFDLLDDLEELGVFRILPVDIFGKATDSKRELLEHLKRIHESGYIESKRLNASGELMTCNSPNCGGYTLEAELGIIPNGISEPDFLGWEIKQFGVRDFQHLGGARVTLMTPEPTDGFYKTHGVEDFVRKYGYQDKLGREDRMNFGGVHKVGIKHPVTGLTLELIGFDAEIGKIVNADGSIALVDEKHQIAASWSFVSLLKHWNRKHAKAGYIPSICQKSPTRKYQYGGEVFLATNTRFDLFLTQMSNRTIYYDPGIKLENISTKPKTKRRSQFRVISKDLMNLYANYEVVDLTKLP